LRAKPSLPPRRHPRIQIVVYNPVTDLGGHHLPRLRSRHHKDCGDPWTPRPLD
jgi:hypothetical protein